MKRPIFDVNYIRCGPKTIARSWCKRWCSVIVITTIHPRQTTPISKWSTSETSHIHSRTKSKRAYASNRFFVSNLAILLHFHHFQGKNGSSSPRRKLVHLPRWGTKPAKESTLPTYTSSNRIFAFRARNFTIFYDIRSSSWCVTQVSSNVFANGDNQNAGNFLTDRPTTRVCENICFSYFPSSSIIFNRWSDL